MKSQTVIIVYNLVDNTTQPPQDMPFFILNMRYADMLKRKSLMFVSVNTEEEMKDPRAVPNYKKMEAIRDELNDVFHGDGFSFGSDVILLLASSTLQNDLEFELPQWFENLYVINVDPERLVSSGEPFCRVKSKELSDEDILPEIEIMPTLPDVTIRLADLSKVRPN